MNKRVSQNASKQGVPPDSNGTLFPGQEAPGAAASRAHFSDKKQLFEQQLKHCPRFLQKKVDRARNRCKKLNGLPKIVDSRCKHTKASVETSVETNAENHVETNADDLTRPGQRPGELSRTYCGHAQVFTPSMHIHLCALTDS